LQYYELNPNDNKVIVNSGDGWVEVDLATFVPEGAKLLEVLMYADTANKNMGVRMHGSTQVRYLYWGADLSYNETVNITVNRTIDVYDSDVTGTTYFFLGYWE
jgi:hypothetical protein